MSVSIANVNPAINSFQNWVDKTNQGLYVISTQAVTADLTTDGSSTTGNAIIVGSFAANVVAAGDVLRGGTLTTAGNLNITTNTTIVNSGSFFVNNTNIRVINTNTHVNTSMLTVLGGSMNVTSNAFMGGAVTSISSSNVTITSGTQRFVNEATNTSFTGTLTTISTNTIINGTNTIINSNTFFNAGVNFDGGLAVDGTTTLLGDAVIGNSVANTVSIVAAVNTAIIPDQDDRRDLGAQDKAWANLYVGTINATRVEYSGDLASVNAISTNTITIGAQSKYIAITNTNIGSANTAGVFTAVPVFSVATTEARTLKLIVQARNANINTFSSSEMLIVHDDTTPHMTVYATLSTNTSAPAYEYSTDISGGNVRVLMVQPAGSGNSNVKVLAQYIKA